MKIRDIKIGDHLPTLRKLSYSDDNIVIGEVLPSFCNSQYKAVYNLRNPKDEIFVLTDAQGYITRITKRFSEVVDCKAADEALECILLQA